MNKKADMISVLILGFIILSTLLFFITAIFLALVVDFAGSDGKHTGIVTAVEENNNLIWDANLAYFKTSDESTQEDVYCVNDLEVMEKLKQVSKEKKIVTIRYAHDMFLMVWECNGGISVITEVEE